MLTILKKMDMVQNFKFEKMMMTFKNLLYKINDVNQLLRIIKHEHARKLFYRLIIKIACTHSRRVNCTSLVIIAKSFFQQKLCNKEDATKSRICEIMEKAIVDAEKDLEAAQRKLDDLKAHRFFQEPVYQVPQLPVEMRLPTPMEIPQTNYNQSNSDVDNLAREMDGKMHIMEEKYKKLKQRVLNLERSTETDTHYSDLRELCTGENPRKAAAKYGKSIVHGRDRQTFDRRAPLQREDERYRHRENKYPRSHRDERTEERYENRRYGYGYGKQF